MISFSKEMEYTYLLIPSKKVYPRLLEFYRKQIEGLGERKEVQGPKLGLEK